MMLSAHRRTRELTIAMLLAIVSLAGSGCVHKTLGEQIQFSGRVTDQQTGDPLADVSIHYTDGGDFNPPIATTNGDGRFDETFTHLYSHRSESPPAFAVVFAKEGYLQQAFTVETTSMTPKENGVYELPFNGIQLTPDHDD